MKKLSGKTADDVITSDGDAAMQKTILATRAALAVPKAKIDAEMTKGKSAKAK